MGTLNITLVRFVLAYLILFVCIDDVCDQAMPYDVALIEVTERDAVDIGKDVLHGDEP